MVIPINNLEKAHLEVYDMKKNILGILTDNTPYSAYNINLTKVINDTNKISVTIPTKNEKSQYLVNENLIQLDGEYYIIKKNTLDSEKMLFNLECEHECCVLRDKLLGKIDVIAETAKNLINKVLNGTGWVFGSTDIPDTKKRHLISDEQSVFTNLITIAENFNARLEFTTQVINGVEVKSVSLYANPIDNGKYVRKRKDLRNVTLSYDTTQMITRATVFGKVLDGTQREVTMMEAHPQKLPYVEDFSYFLNKGYTQADINADPTRFIKEILIRNTELSTPQAVYDYGLDELKRLSVPKVDATVNIMDVSVIPEYLTTTPQIGENIWVFDEDIDLILQAQIVGINKNYDNPLAIEITISNVIEKNSIIKNLVESGKVVDKIVDGETNKIHGMYIKDATIGSAQIGKAVIDDAHIKSLSADKINAGDIEAGRLQAAVIEAINASISEAKIDSAKIGGLDADKITAGDIDTDRLTANIIKAINLSAGTINADKIKVGNIDAGSITTGDLDADRIKTNVISAINASIGTINADKIIVGDIDAGKITTGFLDAARIKAGSITSDKLVIGDTTNICKLDPNSESTGGYQIIKNTNSNKNYFKSGGTAKSKIILASSKSVDFSKDDEYVLNLYGCKEVSNLVVNFIIRYTYTDNSTSDAVLKAITLSYSNTPTTAVMAQSTTECKITTMPTAGKILKTVDFIVEKDSTSSGSFYIGDIKLYKKYSGSLIVNGSIEAVKIKSKSITADQIEAGTITAESGIIANLAVGTAQIANAAITNAKINDLNAGKITAGDISAERMKTNVIDAVNGRIGNATINDAVIGNLSASKIQASVIEAINANIGTAYIDTGIFETINADKISGGKINTSNLSIGSTSGALSISDNTIQIKDNQATPKVRVQIGKDKNNNYGILVMNAAGSTIFDSDVGVYEAGIKDDAVSGDKIREDSVGTKQLNIEELFVSGNAFIKKLQTVELNADMIRTGTISNDRINLNGFITFEMLDSKWDGLFDMSSPDKTLINGGKIATGSIVADAINTRGFTAKDNNNSVTFEISPDTGDVTLTGGLLKSSNYIPKSNGYMIDKDGYSEFNNVTVRGNVELPNGGMTNFGAMIGNDNLLENSDFYSDLSKWYTVGAVEVSSNLGKDGDSCMILSPTLTTTASCSQYLYYLKGGEKYTFSFWSKIDELSGEKPSIVCVYYDNASGNMIKEEVLLQLDNTTQDWKKYQVTMTYENTENLTFISMELRAKDCLGRIRLYNCKFEEGENATPWCLNSKEGEKINYVRIWAGASYESRNNAPFRVLQDGTLYANKGYFNGTFSGDVNIGNIKIFDTDYSDAFIHIYDNTNTNLLTQISGEKESFFSGNFYVKNTGDFPNNDRMFEVNSALFNPTVFINDCEFKYTHTDEGYKEFVMTGASDDVFSYKNYRGIFGISFSGNLVDFRNTPNDSGLPLYSFNGKDNMCEVQINGTAYIRDKISMNNGGVTIEARDGSDGNGKGYDFIVG